MKQITLLLFALALAVMAPVDTRAQAKCFEKGNVLLNPGIHYGFRYYRHVSFLGSGFFAPNIGFSADFGVHDYASVGPYMGIGFDKLGDTKFRYIAVGARGNFHWWQLLDDRVSADLKQEQVELYFTVWMGAYINSSNKETFGTRGKFDGGATFGVRYYPKGNPTFAIFNEWGRTALGWGQIGATIKVGNK